MRMAELSARSGVPTATIKFYLREGLLPPGERLSATQAAYGEEHLRRLSLVRALIQVGRMPVATAREVLAAVDDETLDQHNRLGVAAWALPSPAPGLAAGEDDEAARTARRAVGTLMAELGWEEFGPGSPAYETLVGAVAALARLGYPCDAARLTRFARVAEELARTDLDLLEELESTAEQVEASVALTVLHEPVLLCLRRLAQAEESARRFPAPPERRAGPG
ncbi:MerR family transcriptional regulator [Streptomyces boncukensis]|uniref:MerR family transcriptional regulator n=1 Tax=Streptomyces boncukensis TaxID=2711219 RepID=A0A6G4WPF5_9ACTN|nr:MerR family transcriptional regulator [Streptomyces boncukensis]NGO67085.1 MerR family transcriptional regulator [Streptomyces boncukensis]